MVKFKFKGIERGICDEGEIESEEVEALEVVVAGCCVQYVPYKDGHYSKDDMKVFAEVPSGEDGGMKLIEGPEYDMRRFTSIVMTMVPEK